MKKSRIIRNTLLVLLAFCLCGRADMLPDPHVHAQTDSQQGLVNVAVPGFDMHVMGVTSAEIGTAGAYAADGDPFTAWWTGDAAMPQALTLGLGHPQTPARTITRIALLSDAPPGDFEIWAGMQPDALSFIEAFTADQTDLTGQHFALSGPFRARYVQMRITSDPDGWGVHIAELALLSPTESLAGERFNIAAASNGGHVTFPAEPGTGTAAIIDGVNWAGPEDIPWTLSASELPARIAIALPGRALVDGVRVTPAGELTAFKVSVSDSPLHGYRHQGYYVIHPNAGPFEALFWEPAAARYVIIELIAARPHASAVGVAEVAVLEHPPGDGYVSLLDRGGGGGLAPQESDLTWAESGAETVIGPGEAFTGTLDAPGDSESLEIDAPGGVIRVAMAGDPFLQTTLTLRDGAETLARLESAGLPGAEMAFTRAPDRGRYDLEIERPPHWIAVAWDTRETALDWLPAARAAIERFIGGTGPGENVLLLPFGGDWANAQFLSDPVALRAALSQHPGGPSGALVPTLEHAAARLAEKDGLRTLIVISGPGEGGPPAPLWDILRDTPTRIYTVEMGAHMPLMGDLARAWEGRLFTPADLESVGAAFEQIAGEIRAPARCRVRVETPDTGKLRIQAPTHALGSAAPHQGIVIVLDATVTMNLPLEDTGIDKIDAARESVNAFADGLPPDSALALRFFGQQFYYQTGICEDSALMVPLAPLDRLLIRARLRDMRPQGLSTLAYALEGIPADLEGAPGHKLAVIIADGGQAAECAGDPVQVAARLTAEDANLTIHVIGLEVEDGDNVEETAPPAQLAAIAEAGRGEYFEAANAEQLKDILAALVATPTYRTYNTAGEQVAAGMVNGAEIALPAGAYTIEIQTEPVTPLGMVNVKAGETLLISLDPARGIILGELPPTPTPPPTPTTSATPRFTPTPTLAPNPTSIPGGIPITIVSEIGINVRTTASLTAEIIAKYPYNARLWAVGRIYNNRWIQVQLEDGRLGWVAGWLVVSRENISNLPLAEP